MRYLTPHLAKIGRGRLRLTSHPVAHLVGGRLVESVAEWRPAGAGAASAAELPFSVAVAADGTVTARKGAGSFAVRPLGVKLLRSNGQ